VAPSSSAYQSVPVSTNWSEGREAKRKASKLPSSSASTTVFNGGLVEGKEGFMKG